jgi:hypothetical protein
MRSPIGTDLACSEMLQRESELEQPGLEKRLVPQRYQRQLHSMSMSVRALFSALMHERAHPIDQALLRYKLFRNLVVIDTLWEFAGKNT